MKELNINSTKNAPEVIGSFSSGKVTLNISGNSFPENAPKFYSLLTDWVESVSKDNSSIELNCDINYMASSSLICFLGLLKKCESVFGKDNTVLNWNFESDDDDALKTGEDFSKIVSITINLLPY